MIVKKPARVQRVLVRNSSSDIFSRNGKHLNQRLAGVAEKGCLFWLLLTGGICKFSGNQPIGNDAFCCTTFAAAGPFRLTNGMLRSARTASYNNLPHRTNALSST